MQFDRECLMLDLANDRSLCLAWSVRRMGKSQGKLKFLIIERRADQSVLHHLQLLGRPILRVHPDLHGRIAQEVGLGGWTNDRAGCCVSCLTLKHS